MTQLTQPPDTRRSTARRRDSPALWLGVVAGSLFLHLAAFLGMRWFNLRLSVAQPQLDAVPIELLNDAPPPDAAALAPAPASSADAATLAPSAPTQPEQPIVSDRALPIASGIEAPPKTQLAPATPPALPSTPPDPPRQNSPSPTRPAVSPPSSPASPVPPRPVLPRPAPSTPPVTPGVPPTNTAPSPSNSGSSPIEGSGDLPSVPVDQQENPPQPLGQIMARLSARSDPTVINGSARDVPDQSASPKQTTRSFASDLTGIVSGSASVGDTASCELKPEVIPLLTLGQSASFRVHIDLQGTVLDANPIAEDNAYTQLAGCLLKQWEFAPALSAGSAVESNDLIVEVTLSQN